MGDMNIDEASPAVAAIRERLMDGRAPRHVFAEAIGKCDRQVRNYVAAGMPHEYIGNTMYIVVDPAIEWLRSQRRRNTEPRGRGRPR